MKKLITLLAILGLILGLPSIVYLFQNKTIDGYYGQNYYFINNDNIIFNYFGAIILFIIIIGSFWLYFKLIKNSNKFTSLKKILLSIFFVSIIFMISLPNTSTDVFYYMGTGRVFSEYGENPYYHTINELLEVHQDDAILKNSGIWKDILVVYGPLWIIITWLFNKLSFGSINFLLFIFKFAVLGIHLLNCMLIYKLTKKKKFVIIYGFNPLILFEFLVNVHNDIYLLFFVLLAIYFLKNKNNLILSLTMLLCSVLIKYVTILIVPIFILYNFRNKNSWKRLQYLFLYGGIFLLFLVGIYSIFLENIFDIFKIVLGQQNRIKDSIYLVLYYFTENSNVINIAYSIAFFCWLYIYIVILLKLIMKNVDFREMMKDIYIIYIVLIFGVLTNLTSWYLIWLFIPFIWLKSKDIKNILWIGFFYELVYVYFAFVHSDEYMYSIFVIPIIFIGMGARRLIQLKLK